MVGDWSDSVVLSQRPQPIRNIDDQYRVRRAHYGRWSCVRRRGLVRSIGLKVCHFLWAGVVVHDI